MSSSNKISIMLCIFDVRIIGSCRFEKFSIEFFIYEKVIESYSFDKNRIEMFSSIRIVWTCVALRRLVLSCLALRR